MKRPNKAPFHSSAQYIIIRYIKTDTNHRANPDREGIYGVLMPRYIWRQ